MSELSKKRIGKLQINLEAKTKRSRISLWDSAEWAMNVYSNQKVHRKPLCILDYRLKEHPLECSIIAESANKNKFCKLKRSNSKINKRKAIKFFDSAEWAKHKDENVSDEQENLRCPHEEVLISFLIETPGSSLLSSEITVNK